MGNDTGYLLSRANSPFVQNYCLLLLLLTKKHYCLFLLRTDNTQIASLFRTRYLLSRAHPIKWHKVQMVNKVFNVLYAHITLCTHYSTIQQVFNVFYALVYNVCIQYGIPCAHFCYAFCATLQSSLDWVEVGYD